MRKVAPVAAALAMAMIIPAAAITKSSASKSSKRSSQATKQATEVCKQELNVVGEENFKELYGAGDERRDAAKRCQRFHMQAARQQAQRAALHDCIEQIQGKGDSTEGPPDKATRKAVKECMDQKRSERGDRDGKPGSRGHNGINGPNGRAGSSDPIGGNNTRGGRPDPLADRLEVLKSCTDEKAEDTETFEAKYMAIAEEVRSELKKRLAERGNASDLGQLPGKRRKGHQPGRGPAPDISKLLKEEPRAFRACVGSKLRDLIEERRPQGSQDSPLGGPGGFGSNGLTPGHPGSHGPGNPIGRSPDIPPI